MNLGGNTEHHESHKTSNESNTTSHTVNTGAPASGMGGGPGMTSTTGGSNDPMYATSGPGTQSSGYGNQSAGITGGSGMPSGIQNAGQSVPDYDTGSRPGGASDQVSTPSATHDSSTRPGAEETGAHPNPTHVSNQFRPGTTYNTAPVAKDGASLHGGPPAPMKESINSSINLPENK